MPPSLARIDSQEVVDGAGERTPAVTEQMAVQHVARHRRAHENPEALARTRRRIVNFAGDDLLARPGLASDQRWMVGRGDPARHGLDLTHPRGNEHIALKHEALFDRPERSAMALVAL